MDDRSNTMRHVPMECNECEAPAVRWDCWLREVNRPKIFGNCEVCNTQDSTTDLYTSDIKEAEIWLINQTL